MFYTFQKALIYDTDRNSVARVFKFKFQVFLG